MNLINSKLIDLLLVAAENLRNEVTRALESYRNDVARERSVSQRYKDENEYFQQAQSKLAEIARAAIIKAERVFRGKCEDVAKEMSEQLRKHLSEPVNGQFRDKLAMISDFGLQPERMEIDDLISLNSGNQTGLAALQKVLEKVDSPFKLSYHTTADYQNDIKTVRELGLNVRYIPMEYHSEGCDIFRGQQLVYTYSNGNTLGVTLDSVTLLRKSSDFENDIAKIRSLKGVWAADCSYTDANRVSEAQREDGSPAESTPDPESATKVFDENDGVKVGRELGQRAARNTETYARALEAYSK